MRKRSQLDRVFHALADPTRRRILENLARRDLAVMELARRFSISQPAVTKHLHMLEAAGLIARRQEGRQRVCSIRPQKLQATLDWMRRCSRFWNERIDGLEAFLPELKREGGS